MNSSGFQNNLSWHAGRKDREPAFGGQFYPETKQVLTAEVTELFKKAGEIIYGRNRIRAIISPHAGYVFSGEVAASAFNQIPKDAVYKRVFVIASSHRYSFKGASVYTSGNYIMPMGKIEVDTGLTKQLVKSSKLFLDKPEVHIDEHSLEVQLPFLQYKLGNSFLLVPIIIGINKPEDAKKIANELKPYFTAENLFVISTDFSHYPGFEDAKLIDSITADAICSNQSQTLLDILDQNKRKEINNLSTSLCGWTSVLTLLYLTKKTDLRYNKIEYRNSGDAKYYGQRDRVVGYWAISVTENTDTFKMSTKEKEEILSVTGKAVINYLETKQRGNISPAKHYGILNKKMGAFVSVYVKGELRGCIGNFSGNKVLFEVLHSSAISACNDVRFGTIKFDEMDDIEIEISVLSPLNKIDSVDKIELGKHGVYIKKGLNKGTFLPQVAKKTGWNLTEFLGHCSRDKANIGWDGWKNAEIFIYEAIVFRGKLN